MSTQVLGFLRSRAPFPLVAPRGPAAAGNDAGAPAAPAPGGEGEPHRRPRDARLGSTDKELKAGAAATGSAPTAPGTPRQRAPPVAVMDPAGGPGRLLPRPCRVLVLLNPHSGKGKALQLFQSRVQPLLVEAEISFMLMLTERQNHARELVRSEQLGRWDALVVMSGDGLMHEVVNGLMERPDWETAIQMPLCSLPAGSANALAASLNHYAGYEQVTNEDLLTNCTLLLCRRLLSPMNLLSLHTASGKRLFSVLSLAWGFIADVDLESERALWMCTWCPWRSQCPLTGRWCPTRTLCWCWRCCTRTWAARCLRHPWATVRLASCICSTCGLACLGPRCCASSWPWRKAGTWSATAPTWCMCLWSPSAWSPWTEGVCLQWTGS
nr:sphingosine kinase 1 isoform X3 [Microcebus murinus]